MWLHSFRGGVHEPVISRSESSTSEPPPHTFKIDVCWAVVSSSSSSESVLVLFNDDVALSIPWSVSGSMIFTSSESVSDTFDDDGPLFATSCSESASILFDDEDDGDDDDDDDDDDADDADDAADAAGNTNSSS